MELEKEHCVPCETGEGKLLPVEIDLLIKEVSEWQVENDKLVRKFKFKNFKEALEFVNKVGVLAETEGHHPDISFGWGYVTITLSTHAVKGLSKNDFIMAKKIGKV
ncbi:MAG TPA: 4a-hydroxytetrahydrobiopterin dehydratase [Candidatus Paceibacterota bacterium]